MVIKGIVFDFNGTLFWDTKYHNTAWNTFLDQHGIALSDVEKHNKLHGKNNKNILQNVFSEQLTERMITNYINEKESIYRDICVQMGMELAPGAVKFIEFLCVRDIPYTIATASGYDNVCFFFDMLKLGDYFSFSRVVYDDGSFPGKPNPKMFQKAIGLLNIYEYEALIFEDSIAGIHAAENAKVGKIIIVNSNDENYDQFDYQKITNFSEVDLKIFG